ncbi:MAG: hypothetical protein QOJ32_2148 [Frankiaceae bacterium]|nr:hypothetical protein [Frankiaceae bacterium]
MKLPTRRSAPAVPPPTVAPHGSPEQVEARLRRFEVLVLRRLEGLLQGNHVGLLPGPGSERAESREYRIGDDVRRMDWAVSARTTIPHVSDLIADHELTTMAVVDLSPSMEFGTATWEKRDLAMAATTAFGTLTTRLGSRFGAVLLSGDPERPVRQLPSQTGRNALRRVIRGMAETPRSGLDRALPVPRSAGPGIADALDRLARTPTRRGLVVVVSDLLGSPTAWERPLRALTARHQVLAVEITDPRELELPSMGLLTLVDPETGRLLEVDTGSAKLRARYAEAAQAQRGEVAAALRRSRAGHLILRTDRDWLLDIVRHVARTKRHRGLAA